MRDMLKRLKPNRFEDIIAVVALYRPGPMDNIPSYISRKHGNETVDYLHDDLEKCLKAAGAKTRPPKQLSPETLEKMRERGRQLAAARRKNA